MSNRPKRGSVLSKEPIRDPEAIEVIKVLLRNNLRDLALFILAVNSNLWACDLLALLVGQVWTIQVGDELLLREKKTKKVRRIIINRSVHKALQDWLKIHPRAEDSDAPLFLSRKGGALKVATLNNMVKQWCKAASLTGSYRCHSLRKTLAASTACKTRPANTPSHVRTQPPAPNARLSLCAT